MVEKCDFLKVVKIPYPKNRFLVTLRSFFSTYKFFPVSTINGECFNETMSSLVSKKSYAIFRESTDFGHFWLPRSTFKVDFLNVRTKFRKILGHFPGGGF